MTMKPRTWVVGLLVGAGVGFAALGCEFVFSFSAINASVGTWGEVGIRVVKTHANCTLPNPYDYQISASGAQILEETPWKDVQPSVIEKWVLLSLAEVGDGYLKISKTCTKEGYEEGVLPIRVTDPTPDGAWSQAWNGTYPLDSPAEHALASVVGDATVNEDVFSVGGISLALPNIPPALAGRTLPVRLYYVTVDGKPFPLLIVGVGLLWRYDPLLKVEG